MQKNATCLTRSVQMRKQLFWLLLMLLIVRQLAAYMGSVHEDIVRQALEYLSHISDFEHYSNLHNHDGINVLLENSIEEDMEDWIYGYGSKDKPRPRILISGVSPFAKNTIKKYTMTITHFWNADMAEPVNSSGHNLVEGKWLGGTYTIHNIPSAQRKAERMIYGNDMHHSRTLEFSTEENTHSFHTVPEPKIPSRKVDLTSNNGTFRFSIYSVDDYINNHNILILGHYHSKGRYSEYSPNYYVHLLEENWDSLMQQQGGYEEFEYLGRLAHLLSDMCVPTHTHNDIHGLVPTMNNTKSEDCDQYEGWNITGLMSTTGGYLQKRSSVRWTASDVARVYGYKLIPVPSEMSDRDFLYDLFYTVNQVTAMFPSNDCDGDFKANPQHPFSQYPFILEMQDRIMKMYAGSPDFQKHRGQNLSYEDLNNIQSIVMPMAIRAVATLLYWWGCRYGYAHTDLTDMN